MSQTQRIAAFSLVEVMVAILILGVGVVGLTHGITAALVSNKESQLQTAAALLAAGRIELLRADGWVEDGDDEGEGEEGLALYRWRQSVTSTSIDGLHEVDVVVEHAKSGKTLYELRTLLFDPYSISDPSSRSRPDKSKQREGGRP